MLRIAIVDDDHSIVSQIHEYIDQFMARESCEYQITEYPDGANLIANYNRSFDLIYLDVQMNTTDGLSAARKIRETDSKAVIIFISQMAQYAVDGYSVDALDFLVKPVDYYSFELKMRKAFHFIKEHQSHKIMVSSNGHHAVLASNSILYVEVFDHDLVYHTTSVEYRTSGTITMARDQLSGLNFIQCNRYCIVNMDHVTSIQGNELIVDGTAIQISKRRRKDVCEALMRHFGGQA